MKFINAHDKWKEIKINLKRWFEDVEKQFDIYKAKMESLLISQLELIKDMKKDN